MEMKDLPEGWEWKRLGDVAKLITKGATPTSYGFAFQEIGIKFVKIENIINNQILESSITQFISQEANENQKRSILEEGDILFSIAGTIGNSCLVREGDLPSNVNQAIAIIRGTSHIFESRYLLIFLKSKIALNQLINKTRGVALNNVSLGDVRDLLIITPPLSVQRHIVTVLEQAEALKRQRQDADALTGALLQSVFYEMFGDPVRNERGWETKSFEDCMSSIIDYRGKTPTKTKSGIPLVTAKIVKDGKILPPDEFISPNDYDSWMRRGIPKKGDVILTTEGPLGTVAQLHTDEKLAFAQRLIIMRGKSEMIDNVYLAHFFRSDYFQNQLKSKATGSTVEGISQGNLRETFIRIPPLALQHEFARIFEGVERVRGKQAESGKEIEALCGVLMQRAFRGELVV